MWATSSCVNRSTTWEPMNPAPPITSTRRPVSDISPVEEARDPSHHGVQLIVPQLGEERQRQDLLARLLALGEAAAVPSAVEGLLMKGQRIVHRRLDALLAQVLEQAVALSRSDREEVIDRVIPRALARRRDRQAGQEPVITAREQATPHRPLAGGTRRDAKHARVHSVTAAR